MVHPLREGFLYALCLLTSAATTVAIAGTVDVPFLFSDDQSIPQADLSQGIQPSNSLRNDSYLNAPMTRLEPFLKSMSASFSTIRCSGFSLTRTIRTAHRCWPRWHLILCIGQNSSQLLTNSAHSISSAVREPPRT